MPCKESWSEEKGIPCQVVGEYLTANHGMGILKAEAILKRREIQCC